MENQEIIDEIIKCPMSGGDICYVTQVSLNVKNYFSLSCGYWTNSLITKDSEFLKEQLEILPEIYKDSIWEDPKTGLVWIPSTVNVPDKGMVFLNGTTKEDAKWAAVKAIEIKEEEKEKYPIRNKKGEYYKFRMDMTSMKLFEGRDFQDALSYIQVIPG